MQSALQEAETAGVGTAAEQIDKSAIKHQIRRLDLVLEHSKPGRLSGQQKDVLVKREKELIDIFQIGLPTKYEMDHPGKCPGAVRKHQRWSDSNKRLITEWRNIQRLLRPGEEISIEQLRKDGARSQYV